MAEDYETDRTQELIGASLRRAYRDALDTETPDRFKQMLERLSALDAGSGSSSDSSKR